MAIKHLLSSLVMLVVVVSLSIILLLSQPTGTSASKPAVSLHVVAAENALGVESSATLLLFEEWVVREGRSYNTLEEKAFRLKAFSENLQFVQKHMKLYEQGLVQYTVGLNKFADWTREEYVAFVKRGVKPALNTSFSSSSSSSSSLPPHRPNTPLPTSVDWRTKNCVTPVLNQGQCGSSWGFAAIVALEGTYALACKELVSLSVQQLMDCMPNEQGCNGGMMSDALTYAVQYGMESAASYPYCADSCPSGQKCQYNSKNVVAGYAYVGTIPSGDEATMQSVLATYPGIATAVDASQQSFQLYLDGVYSDPNCSSTDVDHGIGVVGYGVLNGTDYWILKNTWGASWGMEGYMYLARNKKNMCGIATEASYVTV